VIAELLVHKMVNTAQDMKHVLYFLYDRPYSRLSIRPYGIRKKAISTCNANSTFPSVKNPWSKSR